MLQLGFPSRDGMSGISRDITGRPVSTSRHGSRNGTGKRKILILAGKICPRISRDPGTQGLNFPTSRDRREAGNQKTLVAAKLENQLALKLLTQFRKNRFENKKTIKNMITNFLFLLYLF